ncbi:hypothetical protein M409DRAFT_53114 [Zasmidium cellare ATCC 36951]|uniref:Uncharacterized protein n=1 Tax=Zasmidium cellare ATCC 36951 TaxID=1080233 RepID=A0A6A6CMQ7_ZASCE|nr:uncharacterized protein M409DRAFT_53114 [Zasmidium cellare ATCC 36951]KAF2168435.1 hypothetical protein M409DRAFT_53114 [Zasmidium cellare ATCC 36951]
MPDHKLSCDRALWLSVASVLLSAIRMWSRFCSFLHDVLRPRPLYEGDGKPSGRSQAGSSRLRETDAGSHSSCKCQVASVKLQVPNVEMAPVPHAVGEKQWPFN